MKSGLRSRLDRLEQTARDNFVRVLDEVRKAAVAALSDDDLNRLTDVFSRVSDLTGCTPDERAAVKRYAAACELAAMRILVERNSHESKPGMRR